MSFRWLLISFWPRRADVAYSEDSLQFYAAKRFHDVCRKTVHFAVPNGEKRDKITAAKLKKMGVRSGVADFILLCRGLLIAVELKTTTGRQSENQKGFQAVWEAAGGVYVVVRTPEEIDGLIFRFLLD